MQQIFLIGEIAVSRLEVETSVVGETSAVGMALDQIIRSRRQFNEDESRWQGTDSLQRHYRNSHLNSRRGPLFGLQVFPVVGIVRANLFGGFDLTVLQCHADPLFHKPNGD